MTYNQHDSYELGLNKSMMGGTTKYRRQGDSESVNSHDSKAKTAYDPKALNTNLSYLKKIPKRIDCWLSAEQMSNWKKMRSQKQVKTEYAQSP